MPYSRLKPIAVLPGVRVSSSCFAWIANSWNNALLFTADGFEGIAMGLSEYKQGRST